MFVSLMFRTLKRLSLLKRSLGRMLRSGERKNDRVLKDIWSIIKSGIVSMFPSTTDKWRNFIDDGEAMILFSNARASPTKHSSRAIC